MTSGRFLPHMCERVSENFSINCKLVHTPALVNWVMIYAQHLYAHRSQSALGSMGVCVCGRLLTWTQPPNHTTPWIKTCFTFYEQTYIYNTSWCGVPATRNFIQFAVNFGRLALPGKSAAQARPSIAKRIDLWASLVRECIFMGDAADVYARQISTSSHGARACVQLNDEASRRTELFRV